MSGTIQAEIVFRTTEIQEFLKIRRQAQRISSKDIFSRSRVEIVFLAAIQESWSLFRTHQKNLDMLTLFLSKSIRTQMSLNLVLDGGT